MATPGIHHRSAPNPPTMTAPTFDVGASGARIVHCCGFDSIPSDLGVHFLQRESERRHGVPCTRVKMRVKTMRGGFSGGTVASLLNVVKEAVADPALRKELADPYSLCP